MYKCKLKNFDIIIYSRFIQLTLECHKHEWRIRFSKMHRGGLSLQQRYTFEPRLAARWLLPHDAKKKRLRMRIITGKGHLNPLAFSM